VKYAAALLPDPQLVRVDYLTSQADIILLVVTTIRPRVACPDCGHAATRVHSRYRRTVADRPWNAVRVELRIHSRKFFCDQPSCARGIFTERLPGLVARYARRTLRLAEALALIGYALGGEAGARLAVGLGLAVSADTLLRQLRAAVPSARRTPRVLGVDDFAFRRGQRYGTLLVDLERRCPVDLLPDRQAGTLARWLKEHPGVEVITRDRSFEYAKGITEGAPGAVQVADRFHLLTNMREWLERVIEQHRHRLAGIVLPRWATEPEEPTPAADAAARPRLPARRSPSEEATRRARQQRRLALRQQVHTLREAGESILGIAQCLDLNRSTVYRYLRQSPEGGAVRMRCVGSGLDRFLPYLGRRWAEGCHNGNQLWRELREQGYRGSRKMVAVWTRHQRQTPAPTTPKKYLTSPEHSAGAAPPPESTAAARLPSARQLSWFLLREAASLSPPESATLAQIHQAAPELAAIQPWVQQFNQLVRERDLAAFHAWRENVLTSGLPDLCRFVAGLDRDRAAVEAALSFSWSNGPLEGNVNRLKLLKRQMYGRAGFDLLRARVLRAA
jgi:transposase